MKIVFLGDSVTEGCFELYDVNGGFDTVRDPEAVYHNKVKQLWADKFDEELTVINSGISGDNVNGALRRLDKDVLQHDPDAVVVCFGLNDVCGGLNNLGNYINTLEKIFDTLLERNIRVIFMTPNMMNTYVHPDTLESAKGAAETTCRMQNDGTFDTFLNKAKDLCADKNITVVDVYSVWKMLFKNGIDTTILLSNLINHPSREMHDLFAVKLMEVL